MKKNIINIKHLVLALGLTLTASSFSTSLFANKTDNIAVKQLLQPAVKFLGTENNIAVFAVESGNDFPVKFALTITDAEGNQIFSQEFESANFSKVFKLVADNTVSHPLDLSFNIEALETGERHTFEVNGTSESVNITEVTKN